MAFHRKGYGMNSGIPFIKIADRVEVDIDLTADQVSGPKIQYTEQPDRHAYSFGMVSWPSMKVTINGQEREFPELAASVKLDELLQALELKGDRVAVEHNGSIVGRGEWASAMVGSGDQLEIVHFVGGGCQ
jgi:sulfur carrier protein